MKLPRWFQSICLTALLLGLAVLAGCGRSSNYEKGLSAGTGMTDAAEKMSAGTAKIDAVINSLNDLGNSSQADLMAKFKKFDEAVETLHSSAQHVSDVVSKMREQGDDYFKTWDEQVAAIKNEDIKTRSAARRTEMQNKFTQIKNSYVAAGDAFKPFLSDLKDIQTALRTDLTMAGVASVKGAAEKANKDAVPVKASVEQLAQHFKEVGAAMAGAAAVSSAANAGSTVPAAK